MTSSRSVRDDLSLPGLITWSSLISALCTRSRRHGAGDARPAAVVGARRRRRDPRRAGRPSPGACVRHITMPRKRRPNRPPNLLALALTVATRAEFLPLGHR
jgi:hypothetical protein